MDPKQPQQPDPGLCIILKDIYHEACTFYRQKIDFQLAGTQEMDDNDLAIHQSIVLAQEIAKACADPRNFTISQELRVHQDLMLQAMQLLEGCLDPPTDLSCAEFNEVIRKFIDQSCAALQIRKVTAEEKTALIAKADKFQENIKNEEADSADGHIIPFGGASDEPSR